MNKKGASRIRPGRMATWFFSPPLFIVCVGRVAIPFLAGLHFAIAMVWQCLLASIVDQARSSGSRTAGFAVLWTV
ncbi:MAG: hypothetical protein JJV98_01545 [Desulfosarcina sp.]|nr:hypothetical protein [Desulfobacterales bacterium]